MIKTKNISEMLTSLIEEYRFNKNTLSKYLEITEETIDGVVMGNVECLPDDPALRLKILSKAGFLYFGAIEDKDRQLSGFLEVLVSYHGISKLTIAKMAGVEEQDIDRLLANPPEKVEIEVKYKIAVTVMEGVSQTILKKVILVLLKISRMIKSKCNVQIFWVLLTYRLIFAIK